MLYHQTKYWYTHCTSVHRDLLCQQVAKSPVQGRQRITPLPPHTMSYLIRSCCVSPFDKMLFRLHECCHYPMSHFYSMKKQYQEIAFHSGVSAAWKAVGHLISQPITTQDDPLTASKIEVSLKIRKNRKERHQPVNRIKHFYAANAPNIFNTPGELRQDGEARHPLIAWQLKGDRSPLVSRTAFERIRRAAEGPGWAFLCTCDDPKQQQQQSYHNMDKIVIGLTCSNLNYWLLLLLVLLLK